MKRSIFNAWLTALRDPANLQGKYNLTREGADGAEAHCCLGLLCHAVLHLPRHQEFDRKFSYFATPAALAAYINAEPSLKLNDYGTNTLPDTVADSLGMRSDGSPHTGSDLLSLITLNDGMDEGKGIDPLPALSFAEIADHLEAHATAYFPIEEDTTP